MKPVAAIDIGSNTVHLMVGRLRRRKPLKHLLSESALLTLGAEVEEHGQLRPKVAREVEAVLARQLALAREAGARTVLIAATGAIRAAKNGAACVDRWQRQLGVPIRILSSRAEARLSFRGVSAVLLPRLSQLVIDSGGASTEVTLTSGRAFKATSSMAVGGSLLSAQLEKDPPGPLEWARLSMQIGECLRTLPARPRPERALAVGGAAHRLGELNGAAAGVAVTLADLEKIARKLLRHHSRRIARETGIERKKVALLAAGTLILHGVLSHYGLTEVHIEHSGLRDGMIDAHRELAGNWWRSA